MIDGADQTGTPPWSLTLSGASRAIAAGHLSCADLARSVLTRIETTEPEIHAYEYVSSDSLLAEAERADVELNESGPRGPLHGIPFAIKDIVDVAGLATTASSPSRRGLVPAADAEVVRRLRAAGALICGKTVTDEFGLGVESPPTRSPWDRDRIPGGSSGGSGAAVAADSCIAAIGADTASSIRLPAAICGIVGLKPTYGRVSKRGAIPVAWSCDHIGPMTKTVADCARVLQVIAGPDPADPASASREPPNWLASLERGVSGLRIGVPRTGFFEPCDGEVESLVREAIAALVAEGAEAVDVDIPHIDLVLPVALVITLVESAAYHRPWLEQRRGEYGEQVRTLLDAGALVPGPNYIDAQRARRVIAASVRRTFDDHRLDLLATPAAPVLAPRVGEKTVAIGAGEPQSAMLALARNLAPFNLTGQPALSLPCGFSRGQPVGLQLVARPFDEATIFGAGNAYESITTWHLSKPVIPSPPTRGTTPPR
ncbi:MAG: amidase [Actinobacteria bacterium]|nr:amidase [Actinomycetota bacterium]